MSVWQYKEKIIAIYRSEEDYLLTFRGRPYVSIIFQTINFDRVSGMAFNLSGKKSFTF